MSRIFIEAESLSSLGGWVVDTGSIEILQSAYLMAHGMGEPVADAVGTVRLPAGGRYRVFALTRDWTAVWGVKESAGRFALLLDGTPLPETLGTESAEWAWQLAGEVELTAGDHTLALHDLTGFNGRCDAIYLTDEGDAPRSDPASLAEMRRTLSWGEVREEDTVFDLVVVGGGIAGISAALSAIHSGVRVALIHDRAVLGGCNSSEVRVCLGGMLHTPPYPALGNVVKAIAPIMGYPSTYRKECFEDERKQLAFLIREGNPARHVLFLEEAVTETECREGRILSVVTTHTRSGKKRRIHGHLFLDASGDAVLARQAGCEVMYGREAASVFGETLAPSEHERLVMGQSLRWYSEKREEPTSFPDIDWGLPFRDDTCLDCTAGDWEQECGFRRDTVKESEYIRDFGLRAIYANWSFQKNHFKDKERFSHLALAWVSYVGGKREGYRVVGDHILTQRDLLERIPHEDATASATWSIDMHFPAPDNERAFGEAFRSCAYHRGFGDPYPIPYRCLYAKDAENLFLGGRIVSASHVAFSAVRVQRTLGMLGEVVGLAAAICKRHACTPRRVYTEHLDELKARMTEGVRLPDAFDGGTGYDEAYHFKDLGWWHLPSAKAEHPERLEEFLVAMRALGLKNKTPLPEHWEKDT